MRYLTSISLALIVHVLLSIVVLMALACTATPTPTRDFVAEVESRLPTRLYGSQEKPILSVIEHIERGVPIQYTDDRWVFPTPSPECDPALIRWPADRADPLFCHEEKWGGLKVSGSPSETYIWSEDEQCYEWHQMDNREWHLAHGTEPKKYDLRNPEAFHWNATFRTAEEWEKLEEEYPTLNEPEVGSQMWLLDKAASHDHWEVAAHDTGFPGGGRLVGTCIWKVSENGEVVYAGSAE